MRDEKIENMGDYEMIIPIEGNITEFADVLEKRVSALAISAVSQDVIKILKEQYSHLTLFDFHEALKEGRRTLTFSKFDTLLTIIKQVLSQKVKKANTNLSASQKLNEKIKYGEFLFKKFGRLYVNESIAFLKNGSEIYHDFDKDAFFEYVQIETSKGNYINYLKEKVPVEKIQNYLLTRLRREWKHYLKSDFDLQNGGKSSFDYYFKIIVLYYLLKSRGEV